MAQTNSPCPSHCSQVAIFCFLRGVGEKRLSKRYESPIPPFHEVQCFSRKEAVTVLGAGTAGTGSVELLSSCCRYGTVLQWRQPCGSAVPHVETTHWIPSQWWGFTGPPCTALRSSKAFAEFSAREKCHSQKHERKRLRAFKMFWIAFIFRIYRRYSVKAHCSYSKGSLQRHQCLK